MALLALLPSLVLALSSAHYGIMQLNPPANAVPDAVATVLLVVLPLFVT
jgi:hypothetical protein